MNRNTLSPELLRFVRAHVSSIDHLQVLLFLSGEPGTTHTRDEIARAAQASGGRVDAVLADLGRDGLVTEQGGRYGLVNEAALNASLEALQDAYNRLPVQLARAVYDRPPAPLQSFADAFRLRQGD